MLLMFVLLTVVGVGVAVAVVVVVEVCALVVVVANVVVDTVVVVDAALVGGDAWHGRGPVATVVDVVTVCYGSCCGQLAGRGSSRNY